MKMIETKQAPGAIGPYSQGWEVNGLVFTSGQIPVDPDSGAVPEGIAAQAAQSCKNVGAILEAAGSDLTRVVKTTCFWPTWGILPRSTRSTPGISPLSPPGAAWR